MPNHVLNKITIDTSNSTLSLEEVLSQIAYTKDEFEKYCEDNIFNPFINTINFNRLIPMPKDLDIDESTDTKLSLKYIINLIGSKTKDAKELIKTWNESSIFTIDDTTLTEKEKKQIKENQSWYAIKGLLIKKNIKRYGYPNWYSWRINNWGTNSNAYEFFAGELTNQIIFYTAWTAPLKVYHKLTTMFPDVVFTFEWASEDVGNETGYAVIKNEDILDYKVYNEYGKDSIEYAKNLWNSIR